MSVGSHLGAPARLPEVHAVGDDPFNILAGVAAGPWLEPRHHVSELPPRRPSCPSLEQAHHEVGSLSIGAQYPTLSGSIAGRGCPEMTAAVPHRLGLDDLP